MVGCVFFSSKFLGFLWFDLRERHNILKKSWYKGGGGREGGLGEFFLEIDVMT